MTKKVALLSRVDRMIIRQVATAFVYSGHPFKVALRDRARANALARRQLLKAHDGIAFTPTRRGLRSYHAQVGRRRRWPTSRS
jgi:hypothetical protein